MANPIFEDDSEDGGNDADKAAVDKMKARIAEAQDEAPVVDDETPVIAVSEEEDDGEERLSRDEKKRNRFREAQERAEAAEREAAHYRSLYETSQRPAPREDPAPGEDPKVKEVDNKLAEVRRRQKLLYQEFLAKQGKLSQQEIDQYERDNHSLRDEEGELIYERRRLREAPQEEARRKADAQRAIYQQKYGDIYAHERSREALIYAEGVYKQSLVRNAGRKTPEQLMDEAMDAARRDVLRTVKRPAPSESTRRRYAGEPSGPAAGAGDRDVVSVPMTKEYRRMATALYPGMPENEAYKRWAKGPGKRIIQAQQRRAG